ncbi:MAG: sigma-54-dependent Fis family transcriptional regulator [Verrucomicrobia bacterium]|nr:sigma-54-dependent Fis family transcriptional regulator [Verrucomicrobiota bacterium]
MPRILIVDDNPVLLLVLNNLLTSRGYETTTANNGEEGLHVLQDQAFDLMIADIHMSPVSGMELLSKTLESYAQMSVIMLTADNSLATAVEAMKQGAFDYLTKPFKLNELLQAVRHALEYHWAITKHRPLGTPPEYREHVEKLQGIIAESPAMLRVCELIRRIAPSDTTVFIHGERGSGKTLVARDLHRDSQRKSGPFLAVNCAALPVRRIEAELFGRISDGSASEPGLFESAHGGTLFLNEIGALPLAAQSSLLCALQEKQILKVGGGDPVPIDVRVIVASSENLEPRIQQGTFCEDLYHRLHALHIDIPPMRNRPEDLLPIIDQALRRKLDAGAEVPALDLETEMILESYAWPNNVREVEEAVQHALTFVHDGVITKEMLPAGIVEAAEATAPAGVFASHCAQFKGRSLRAFLHDKEKEILDRIHARLDKESRASEEPPAREKEVALPEQSGIAPDEPAAFEWI